MTKLPHDSADAAALTQLQVGSVFGDLPDILMEKMMTTWMIEHGIGINMDKPILKRCPLLIPFAMSHSCCTVVAIQLDVPSPY